MHDVPSIVRQRNKRRGIAKRNPLGGLGLGISILLSLAFVLAGLVIAFAYTQLSTHLPSPDALPALLSPSGGLLLQPTRLYDNSGQHLLLSLENPAASGWQYQKLDQLPTQVVNAILVSTEPDFWKSPGFSVAGLIPGEHPTLAQRLVSDLLLWNEPAGLRRNLRERLLAAQVTAQFGRDQVLEWYLNNASFGPLVYGIDAAARVYFNKPSAQLSLAEAASLAAIGEAPDLSPLDAPQVVSEKQKQVIHDMVSQGMISDNQAAAALQTQVDYTLPVQPSDAAPAFTRLVLEQLETQYSSERIRRGGLRIYTSLDYDLQKQASCAARIQLARLNPPAVSESTLAESDCPSAKLLPAVPAEGRSPPGLKANIILLDPRTGSVLAMVGDTQPGSDPAHMPGHPPGSLLTPFIYLTSFTQGLSPASLVWDIPASLPAGLKDQKDWMRDSHGPIRLRTALANDYLISAVQQLAEMGPDSVGRTLQQFGLLSMDARNLDSMLQQVPLLSGGEVNLLQMSQAYGIFANQGVLAGQEMTSSGISKNATSLNPITILKVEGLDHSTWMDCTSKFEHCSPGQRPVTSSQLAYLVTNILSDETARWPSLGHPNALETGRPAGVKMGTTGSDQNAWTIGFTPRLVVGVWIGSRSETADQVGKSSRVMKGAADLWHAMIQYASRKQSPEGWPIPPGVQNIVVCDPSGMLPSENCPTVVNEIFLPGNEPSHADTLYQVFQVNRETGRLATIFTPPDLVEGKVYLVYPPEAEEWAAYAHLPVPPSNYDVINAPAPTSKDVSIQSPEMFAYVSGKVQIKGTAGGSGLSFYRLQVGQGLNPQEWIQIGKDVSTTVHSAALGEWDTRGLSGLYALQLQVVRQDHRIETATIQVTIDNQPPGVTILHPEDGQQISSPANNTVILEVQAEDELSLARVEFYVDNVLVATLFQKPYTLAWKAQPGSHTFLVKAYDLANNTSQTSTQYSIGK